MSEMSKAHHSSLRFQQMRHLIHNRPVSWMLVSLSSIFSSKPSSNIANLNTNRYLILAMLSDQGVPARTIAPKFTGAFNKGVDYQGDLAAFAREFEDDLIVIKHAAPALGLPRDLKLSVHSGSDKFSLYPIINRLTKKYDAGLHLKTAGTTWLEEIAALAVSGDAGRDLAVHVYREGLP